MVHHCTIEYLPNIRQLCILIPINVSNTEVTSKLYFDREKKLLHTQQIGNSEILISVPGLVSLEGFVLPIEGPLQNFPHVNRIDNVLVIQFKDVSVEGTPLSLMKLPSAKDLQSTCEEIACANCSNTLKTISNSQFIFKDLPNEHWLELLDCWSCHDNEFAPIAEKALGTNLDHQHHHNHNHQNHHSHNHHIHNQCTSSTKETSYHEMNNSSQGLILPPAGKIYLGCSYILMNCHDFNGKTCPHCNAEIGEPVQDGHIKIFRDLIQFKGIVQFAQESFVNILMHRIIDTIDNHSTFHFILKSSSDHKDQIYLRPINWNLQLYDLDTKSWKIAFKLGYSRLSEAAHIEAETVTCTQNQFNQIVEQLEKNHEDSLFNSFIKIPGTETLKLSYLIN